MSGKKTFKDTDVQLLIGNMLRWGVIISMIVVSAGGVIYILRHGHEVASYRTFKSEPDFLKNINGIINGIWAIKGRAVIQAGILLLIATPVVRVILSVISFSLEKDYLYVVITLIVLAIIICSMLSGTAG